MRRVTMLDLVNYITFVIILQVMESYQRILDDRG